MALKNICLLPHGCDLEFLRLHRCDDGSHAHISSSQLKKYESDKTVKVLVEADETHARTVAVRKTGRSKGIIVASRLTVRDRSCALGAYLLFAIRGKEEWALVMYADIRRRRGHPAEEMAA